jgi:hypothetical protein
VSEDVKVAPVDRERFTDVIRKLIATPPLPKALVSRKIARTARQKQKPAAPKSAQ